MTYSTKRGYLTEKTQRIASWTADLDGRLRWAEKDVASDQLDDWLITLNNIQAHVDLLRLEFNKLRGGK